MTKRTSRRSYRRRDRRIWVDSELNKDLEPAQLAQIITQAALAQAHLETEAKTAHQANLAARPSRQRGANAGASEEASDA